MTLAEQQAEAITRIKAPVRHMTCSEIECPWCLADQTEECGTKDDHTCTECKKQFRIAEDEDGVLSTVGVITAADRLYLEWERARQ